MTAKDVVCGMDVEIENAEWKSEYNGTMYYFCAPGCKASFDKDPEKYLQGGSEPHMSHEGHPHH